ncbi:hypothetical protein KAR91_06705 [Candidatus Pacearchaeota archaeon]|nr:hypothetical protein [Candidatus Pacearchaeota archaeon]
MQSKQILIDSIVFVENMIADLTNPKELEFQKRLEGFDQMSIPGLKVIFKNRNDFLEKCLANGIR